MDSQKRFSIFEVGHKSQPDCDLGEGVKNPEHSHPGLAPTHRLAEKNRHFFKQPGKPQENRGY